MSGSPQQPTYAELAALVVWQAAVIEALTARGAQQEARIAELERQLGRTSKNSSLPPSSDRFSGKGKRPPWGAGRNPGKQPATPGAGRELTAEPDEIIDHVPAACGGCGADLSEPASGATSAGVARRQVRALPEPVAAHVREHRVHRLRCGCGHTTIAAAPAGVTAPVQYGPRLIALVAYLIVVQHLPYARAVRLVADLYPGVAPSTG